MQRLANFDVSRQFVTRKGQIAAQLTFGALCGASMIGIRNVVDIWAPNTGPFAMIYPTVLLATLYGHWRAGAVALALSFFWAWYFVLPAQGSFTFSVASDPQRVLINAACALIVLVFSEAFRRAARATVRQIQLDSDRRLMLLHELEHRTKNNFALVASMLEIQKRRLGDPALHAPLDDAVGRVRTFADAYSSLGVVHDRDDSVAMKGYIDLLLDRIEKAALPPKVTIYREIEDMALPREVAVAIGLYINEALANCAKYAFPSGQAGTVGVYFHRQGDGWRLSVEDDGAGLDGGKAMDGGLGSSLMYAFADQANADHAAGSLLRGYRTEMTSAG